MLIIMKIAVGSKNPKKIEAVKDVFKMFFDDFEIVGIEVLSDVSDQPFNDHLKIGAINRAKKALERNSADFGVGIEGGIIELYGQSYITSFTAITDKNGKCHGAHDMLWECPKVILDGVKEGKEMGQIMDEITKDDNVKQKQGGIGYFTKGKLPRRNAMINGIIGALIPFLNKENYS